jgi:protein-arginine kinase activator protein McsA
MPNFVTLTCPSCGGKLEITPEIDRFACANCGNEHIVQRSGGIISVIPLVAGLHKVQEGVDRTASELAIKRLREELSVLESELEEFLDEVDEVNVLYKLFPQAWAVNEENIDKIISVLEKEIQNLHKGKANNPFLRWITRTSDKLEAIESLAEELRDLITKINKKRVQLARHESIVNQ